MKTAEQWNDQLGDIEMPEHGKLNWVDYDRKCEALIRAIQADALEAAALECGKWCAEDSPASEGWLTAADCQEAIRKLKPEAG